MNQELRRILNAIAAGTMTAADDSGTVQRHQVKIGYMELLDQVPVVQQFGLASCPPLTSDVIVLFIGGDRSNAVVIGSNNQGKRPTGQAYGETSLFNAFGMSIYISKNGIVFDGGGKPFHFVNGDVHVDGAVLAGYGSADQIGLQTHTHEQLNDSHGDTEQPTQAPNPGT
jgi:phage gp45-like